MVRLRTICVLFELALLGLMSTAQSPQLVTMDVAPAPSAKFPASWYPADNNVTYTGAPDKGAPYTATLITALRFVDPSSGLQKILRTSTFQARDAEGRQREEEVKSLPDNNGGSVTVREVSVNDRVSHCTFQWEEPWIHTEQPAATVTCLPRTLHFQKQNIFADTLAAEPAETKSLDTVDRTEPIGTRIFGDLVAYGARRTRTVSDSANGKTEKIVTEVWYSTDLKELLEMKPIAASPDMDFVPDLELKDIHRGDPDPKLFYPPTGYAIHP